jgi:hypothetical protein
MRFFVNGGSESMQGRRKHNVGLYLFRNDPKMQNLRHCGPIIPNLKKNYL